MTRAQRILVAHHHSGLLARFSEALLDGGYEVRKARTAAEALAWARDWKPLLVLAAKRLPGPPSNRLLPELRSVGASDGLLLVCIDAQLQPRTNEKPSGTATPEFDDHVPESISAPELLNRTKLWLRLQASEAARRTNERVYQQLLELVPNAIAVMDAEGRLLTVSRQSALMLGYNAAEDLVGKSVFAFAVPADHERIKSEVAAVLRDGTPRKAEYTVLLRNGTSTVWEMTAAPMPNPKEGAAKLLLVGRDLTEAKRTHAALAEQERELRKVLETALEGVWLLDAAGLTMDVNGPMAAMLGYTVEEMKGRHLFEFMDEEARPVAAQKLKQREQGIAGQHDFRFRRKDGTDMWGLVSAAPLRDDSGRYLGVLGMVTDITGRKQAADALVASELRYRSLIELSPDAIYVNRGNRIAFVNPAAVKLFGAASPDQLLGRSSLELFTPDQHHLIRQRREALERGERVPLIEQTIRRLNGQVVEVAVTAAVFVDQEGPGVQVILRDITERKKAEAALRQREEMSRQILATAMDGFWMAGMDGQLLDVNEAYCRMSGYTRQELRAMRVSDLEVNEPSPKAVAEHMRRIFETGSDRFETRHRRQDGRVIDVEVSVNYLESGQGAGCVFAFLHDITDRKRIAEQLTLLAHAMESTTESVCITDLHDRFIYVNRAFQQTYGYSEAEILGKTPRQIISSKNPESLLNEILRQSRLGGWRGEVLDIRKDGSEFPIFLSSSQVKDREGRVIGLMGVAQDITQRKRAEAALRESERRYRLLFETMLQGVVYQDPGGKVIAMNPAAERILGKTPQEFVGQTSRDLELHTIREDGSPFPGRQHPAMVALQTGQNASAVMGVFNPRQREYRWIRISAVPLLHEGESKPYQVYALFDDITERKQAQDQLHRAHRRVTAILESITDGFNSFDLQWRYTYINSAGARILGRKPEEVLGKNVWSLWPHASQLRFGKEFQRAMEENHPVYFEEFYPEPLNVWLETRCYPSAEGLAVFFNDVTARKRAEAEMEALRQQVSRVGRMQLLGELTAALAHELNQPLTAIMSNAQAAEHLLAAGRASLPELREILQDVIQDDQRAAEVIRGLRSLLAEGEKKFAPVNLNDLVQQTTRLIRSEALLNEVTLTFELGADLPPVLGDRIQLQQVLLNLVSNAFDAMKSQPATSRRLAIITCRAEPGFVTLRVRDSGHGIAAENLGKLFDSFFTTKAMGMGMGLPICRSIVQAHGGRIWAENNLDFGATFSFTVPVVSEGKP